MIMAGYSNVGSTDSGGASRRASGEEGCAAAPSETGGKGLSLVKGFPTATVGGSGKAGPSPSNNNSEGNSSGVAAAGWASAAAAAAVAAAAAATGGAGGISSCSSSSPSSCMASSSEKSDSVPESGVRSSGSGGSGGSSSKSSSCGGSSSSKKRFVGVRQRPSGRWVAEIKDTTQKIRLWLGTFDTAEDAAKAYDEAACMLRGANTRTNFVTRGGADVAASSALPSKAARLLQLRRNAAAKVGAGGHSREQRLQQLQQQQKRLGKAPMNEEYAVCARFEGNSSLLHYHQALTASAPPSHSVAAVPAEALVLAAHQGPTKMELSENLSSETICKSESSSLESSAGESAVLDHNATTTSRAPSGPAAIDDRSVPCASPIVVDLEARSGYCSRTPAGAREPVAVREESRKESGFCPEPPLQQSFTENAGGLSCSGGLSGLDDVDGLRDDCIFTSPPFDFSADIGSDLVALSMPPLPSNASHQMRRMSYEREIPGAQDCLIQPPPCSASWAVGGSSMLSSPSLTLPGREFGNSSAMTTAYPASSPRLRLPSSASVSSGNGGSGWSNSVVVPNSVPAASSGPGNAAEALGSPRDDAMWQSFDLPSLFPLSVC